MKKLLLIVPFIGLSACAVTVPPLGEAMTHNTNIQAIDPSPEQKKNTYIPADGSRQKLARDAYRKGEVKPLEKLRTRN